MDLSAEDGDLAKGCTGPRVVVLGGFKVDVACSGKKGLAVIAAANHEEAAGALAPRRLRRSIIGAERVGESVAKLRSGFGSQAGLKEFGIDRTINRGGPYLHLDIVDLVLPEESPARQRHLAAPSTEGIPGLTPIHGTVRGKGARPWR